jgi:hypothetical protein
MCVRVSPAKAPPTAVLSTVAGGGSMRPLRPAGSAVLLGSTVPLALPAGVVSAVGSCACRDFAELSEMPACVAAVPAAGRAGAPCMAGRAGTQLQRGRRGHKRR